jgi:hypothetical protein
LTEWGVVAISCAGKKAFQIEPAFTDSITSSMVVELRVQPGVESDIFKPQLESGIFKCISWLNCSFMWVVVLAF